VKPSSPGWTAGRPVPGAAGRRFCLVVSRYHGTITERLESGARRELLELGVDASDVDVVSVPGAWELPWGVRRAVATERYEGVVALGCVIRGETPHFDYVCRGATDGLARVASEGRTPVGFGLLTCDTAEQAEARAGGAVGNKGAEAARAVAELCGLATVFPPAGAPEAPR
jgi:6,7-dimethyl-8-ribityllumazine synthase